MNINTLYAALKAGAFVNPCSTCMHIQYIADYNHHICMLNKHIISPSSISCSKYFPTPNLQN